MKFRISETTEELIEDTGNLPENFFKSPWKEATELEALNARFIPEKLKENCDGCCNYIKSIYPITKQINISNRFNDYGEVDFLTMKTYIESARTKEKNYETSVNACTTIEELNSITINFEE